ncbi:glycoside hydrolase family 43 protein [Streptomyces sp. LBUM 1478]|uniref:glycoside hydrolase family 43 protein n=2 Tax=Streptomyces scabiei TaxID=1930 RepID=UPI000773FBCC|nr:MULTISPECIES: glycoside hydrolase family 43 protein [Streptomyces]MBP5870744.1 glycoside hydrolase family 43 protein [Streptomyces sp. LBUM 1485]MBP5908705.1 glycoside hydrolase family 43 protein [Streptomyces sp. LBUM 1478]MBP5913351.1 glycoside hydrolase family 43 protein [Streptomyces sp. LBUM 1486]MBP5920255.1 glycoside hydrolase family 43 protein [Streptomyces sp. LBUM 1483]MDX2532177.1 glycoside hydrolase family 43 protein [Streptomyces scabiei]
MIHNPVLRGFEPDPAILRVGDDFYIATSTFEWYPGVRLHHSRDLVDWRPLGGVLDSRRLLDLTGVPDSGGVWAPGLSYADGLFHLVFTVVDTYAEGWKDLPNHVTTAPAVEGPWSDPVPLHGRGFDVSLFHDHEGDGRSWLLNMRYDWRPGHTSFAGIELQEYDRTTRSLRGEVRTISVGTAAGVAEGPHLYHRDGWYYLVHAEGGTGYEHGAAVARSRDLFGPYEPNPAGPLLTSRYDPKLELQKAGHCSLVQTQKGQWYAAHITARPYGERGRCVLGRETALQPVTWTEDGWPRIADAVPAVTVPAPDLPSAPAPERSTTDRFEALGPDWSTLRRPAGPDWIEPAPGRLRIRGGQSPAGRRAPSLVARRVTARQCVFETEVIFAPRTPDHLAGLTAYYNTRNWHYLYVTAEDDGSPALRVLSCEAGKPTAHPSRVPLEAGRPVLLRAEFDGPDLHFSYDAGSGGLHAPGPCLDATVLSDEHADEFHDGQLRVLGFTGAMVGLWVQDLDGAGVHADFAHATYRAAPDGSR